MVRVKSFGNDTLCRTAIELKDVLLEFKLMSVSIVQTKSSGIQSSTFVDIRNDGTVVTSYGAQPVSLDSFNFES